jgi:hypothetical protein
MSFIGNTPTQQAFTAAVDVFSGNGSTTAFTLSRPVASVAQVEAVIENVQQSPVDAYTVNGNTITFTSAPPSGSSNIYVRYTSPITQVIAPSDGTVGTSALAAGAVTAAKVASGQVFALNGVAFPATQVPSADANTLDDYEEGTWTPTIYGSTGAGTTTYSSDRWGRYVKIGGWVYVQFCVNWTTSTGATGNVVIGGLPFTTSNFSGNHYPTAPIGFYNYGSSTGWGNLLQTGLVVPNSTTIYVYYSASNTMTALGAGVLNSGGGSLYMSTMYLAA